jgi:hypothetical protein
MWEQVARLLQQQRCNVGHRRLTGRKVPVSTIIDTGGRGISAAPGVVLAARAVLLDFCKPIHCGAHNLLRHRSDSLQTLHWWRGNILQLLLTSDLVRADTHMHQPAVSL